MANLYLDTSIIVALANSEDEFHNESLNFVRKIRNLNITITVGDPLLLELGKAVERRGIEAASNILQTIEHHKIILAALDPDNLFDLANRYFSRKVVGAKYRFDLLHYASATLLGCSNLASWDKAHFNQNVGRKVNAVNSALGLTNLNVGDPVYIARSLGLD